MNSVMNNKLIGVLSALLVVLLIGVLFNLRDSGDSDEMIGRQLFPTMKEQLEKLTLVELNRDSEVTHLEKVESGQRWTVRERQGYSADFTALSDLINALADARLVERKTNRPENFSHLGLDDASAVRFRLTSDEAEYNLWVGGQATGRKGHYVRLPEDNQSWLIDQSLEFELTPAGWLETTIINLDSKSIDSVLIESPEGEQLEVRRVAGEDNLQLVGQLESEKLRYPGAANELSQALVNVRLDDLVLDSKLEWEDVWKAVFSLTEGHQVNALAQQQGEKYFMRFEWIADATGETDDQEEVDYASYEKLGEYVFEVPEHVFGDFAVRRQDLIGQ